MLSHERRIVGALALLLLASCATTAPPARTGVSRQLAAGAPSHLWSRGFASSSPTGAVAANAMRADGSALVAGGSFQSTVDFGCGPTPARGGPDGWIGRFAADGSCQWAAQVGGAGAQANVTGVAVDSAGDVYAAGWFNRVVTLSGVALVSDGGTDGFLAKYTAAGALAWSTRMGGEGQEKVYAVAVAADAVLVTGYFTGTASFGGDPLTSAGATDAFMAAYALDGRALWSQRLGGTGADMGTGVAARSGDIVLTGTFSGTVDFGGGPVTSAGGRDVFVKQYSGDGVHGWIQTAGSPADDASNSVAIDADGAVVVTGCAGTPPAIVLTKYTAGGAPVWSQSFRSPTFPLFGGNGRAVDVADDGSVALTGSITDDVDFGGGALAADYTADIFLAEFSSAGAHRWSQRFPGAFRDEGEGVAFDPTGIAAAGVVADAVDFGGGPIGGGAFLAAFAGASAPPTPSASPTETATLAPSLTATATRTATASPTATATPSASASATRTASATATASRTASPVPTETDVPSPTATATASPVDTPTATPALLVCDVTRNGGISSLDATWILQHIAGLRPFDATEMRLADASGNGQVTTIDAMLILRWVVGQHELAPRCGTVLP